MHILFVASYNFIVCVANGGEMSLGKYYSTAFLQTYLHHDLIADQKHFH